MRPVSFLILLGCVAGVVGVAYAASASAAAAGKAAAPKTPTAAPPGDTLTQIRALIGDAPCTDSSQCRTLAVGARACGGPQAYLPWSSAHTDGAALAELAARFKGEREAALHASGEMSDCRFLPDPGAVCRAGTCQLNPAGQGGQSAI